MLQDKEIDVLAAQTAPALSMDNLPSVDDLPVLPEMKKLMDVDLAVNADGRVYIFYDGKIAEDTEYVLYSIDDASLHLVSHNGRQQNIGMVVHKPMRKYMRGADNIFIIEMKDDPQEKTLSETQEKTLGKIPGRMINIPMVIHDIGL